ncbi:MAG: kelch repeat-containing protein [Planctomycetota bacterium]
MASERTRSHWLGSVLVLAVAVVYGCDGGGGSDNDATSTYNLDLLWSASKLQAEITSDPDLVVLDCRQAVTDTDGSFTGVPGATYIPYDREHITGSFFLDFFLFGDPYPTEPGVQDAIVQRLSELGITTTTPICLYDTGIANPQGKVFFQLERQGCTNVHILDGGFPNWEDVGGAVSTTATPLPTPSTFVAKIDDTSYIEMTEMKAIFDDVVSGSTKYTLTDYREEPLYDGHKICPDAARHGRVPDCGFLCWMDYFDSSTGLWKTADEIEALNLAAGLRKDKVNVIICNKGWRTGCTYFALRYTGWPKSSISHYVGGIREWSFEDPTDYPMISDGCYNVGESLPDDNKWAKRWAGASAQVGSEVWCIGGYVLDSSAPPNPSLGQSKVSDRVQVYDIDTDSWRTTSSVPAEPPALPAPVAFGAATPDSSGNIYLIGGLDSTGTIIDKVYRYEAASNTWSDFTGTDPLPVGRYSYAAAAVGDTIYVSGGLTSTVTDVTANYSADVYAYTPGAADGSKWDLTLPDLPQGRRCHAMVALGSMLYVLAGFYYDDVAAGGVDLRDVWALDTTNVAAGWVAQVDLPMDIAGHGAAVHESSGKVYILGGWTVEGIKYDVIEYDPAANTAQVMKKDGKPACIGWPRYWYFIGASGDLVASIGGYGGVPSQISGTPNGGFTHFQQTYVYDLANTFD